MYFITKQDPNYIIKGSRDPLGFQVIWQNTARQLIPNLSTVSNNIIDFQVMCLANYYKLEHRLEEQEYRLLFSRLEKLFGYVRFAKNHKLGFNGVDKIRKLYQNAKSELKLSDDVEILSNQRAYGIWGKYNRPFQESGLIQDEDMMDVVKQKINSNSFSKNILQRVLLTNNQKNFFIRMDDLEKLNHLIEKPTNKEKELFIDKLLRDKINNSLLKEFNNDPELLKLNPYQTIQQIRSKSINNDLIEILDKISRTEQILCPLNRVFRHLQTKASWTISEIENDENIASVPKNIDDTGLDEKLKRLNYILKKDNLEMVNGIVNQNKEVTELRKSAAWMEFNENRLEVNLNDGGFPLHTINVNTDYDNSYFLDSYSNLYAQLN